MGKKLSISALVAAVAVVVAGLWSWRIGAERGWAAQPPNGLAGGSSETPGPRAELVAPGLLEPSGPSTPGDVGRALAQDGGAVAQDDVKPGGRPWADVGFSAYVLEQPPWSEDDRFFQEKYAAFTRTELDEARKIVGWHLFESATPWVEQRLASGDYLDVTDGGEGTRPTKVSRIHQVITPEGLRTLRFDFPEQDYPLIAYLGREQVYLSDEAYRRGEGFGRD